MEINWDEAPEWADRVCFAGKSDKLVWSNNERYEYVLAGGGGPFVFSDNQVICYSEDDLKLIETRPDEWQEGEKRMDNIGQNGNDGHYERKVVEHDKKNKYSRKIKTISLGNVDHAIYVDVYDVLTAFEVVNPAMAHAVKKMLAPGQRGVKDTVQDMKEAIQSIERAIELEK